MYVMDYYSAIKKEWNYAICRNRNISRDGYAEEVTQRKTNIKLYRIFLKIKRCTNELIWKTVGHKTNLWLPGGKEVDSLEYWDWYIHTTISKIDKKIIIWCIYSTRNSIQYLNELYEKESRKAWLYVYNWFTLMYTWN